MAFGLIINYIVHIALFKWELLTNLRETLTAFPLSFTELLLCAWHWVETKERKRHAFNR